MKTNSTIINLKHIQCLLAAAFFLFSCSVSNAQMTSRVLFLGNSYIGVNNLPQIAHDVALSVGDTLIFDSYTLGGYRLLDHSADVTSQNKVMTGGWDYVVLQAQSQESILYPADFSNGGRALNNLITQHAPCASVLLYMTWGRKNGNATYCPSLPVMCTYEGMDTTIRDNYLNLASSLYSEVSPVSVVWNYIRQNYPSIELYQTDESHPSAAGSYAAACCFYTSIFKKDPTAITFDFGLNASDASTIRDAVKTKVFNNLNDWDYKALPISDFRYSIGLGSNEVSFVSLSFGTAETYLWDFGDGTTSTLPNPTHTYLSNGTYTVELTTTNCDPQGLHTSITDTIIQFCNHTPTIFTSQPGLCQNDTLWTEAADSYQWFYQGQAIPETNQYLANYYQYGISGFSVRSTENACSELSQLFTETPQWSGYYFDMTQGADLCLGDTITFFVLHINGFLSGAETIRWYKNDTLLSFASNDDSLFITTDGVYECKVIDPNSNCPLDTTSFLIQFDCGVIGIEELDQEVSWSLFPNPASEYFTVEISQDFTNDQILIYNFIGVLTKLLDVSTKTKIDVSDLPSGIYFVRLKNKNTSALKLIKL